MDEINCMADSNDNQKFVGLFENNFLGVSQYSYDANCTVLSLQRLRLNNAGLCHCSIEILVILASPSAAIMKVSFLKIPDAFHTLATEITDRLEKIWSLAFALIDFWAPPKLRSDFMLLQYGNAKIRNVADD